MGDQVLVTYATKYGATAESAEKVAQVLREAGLNTDVLPTEGVSDLDPHRAVVLRSAIYMGRWRKNAVRFLQANEKTLAQLQVWLFSSGPTEEGDPVELLKGERFPKAMQPIIDSIQPRDIGVFHGYNNPEKVSGFQKWMIKRVKAPMGDFRVRDAITSWAADIASRIQ